jgi:AraC-like DNA-binding protein
MDVSYFPFEFLAFGIIAFDNTTPSRPSAARLLPMSAPGVPHALFTARAMSAHNRAEMRAAFDQALMLADRNRLTLRRLAPGEMCIIPPGVPHGEVVHAGPDTPFRNLVAGFYNNTLSLHFAHEARPGKPDIEVIEFFDAPHLDVFLTLANTAAQTHSMQGPARDTVLKGLLLALLGSFRNIVETGTGQLNSDIGKVFQAKCLVREQFANPELGVQHIAEQLGCSADYLSHLFHVETKERLTHYIQRIRIEGAILALETATLTVAEIAYASGFADPAYFARVFKQHKGMTPQVHRAHVEAQRQKQEPQPKTVYFDHLDYTHGAPLKKEAPAAK